MDRVKQIIRQYEEGCITENQALAAIAIAASGAWTPEVAEAWFPELPDVQYDDQGVPVF